MSAFHFDHWSRRLAASGLIFLTVLTTGALAWESWRSSRSARATAEAVLRDYSTFAAWQFARETQARLDGAVSAMSERIRHDFDGQHGTPTTPGLGFEDCGCTTGPPVSSSFKQVSGEAPIVIGEPLAESLRATLVEALEGPGAGTRYATVFHAASGPGLALFGVVPSTPRSLTGAVYPISMLTDALSDVFANTPLLPSSLIGNARSRDMFSVWVTDDGRDVFTTGGEESAYTGVASLPARFDGLQVHAAIPADRASRLVIGGLPSSRWPLTMTLFGLSTLLAVLAVRQMRREVHFAQRQADFVSGVSHELRTPLAQIRLFGETLLLGRVRSDDERRRAAEIIVQESRRLGSLVDTVLLFSRMQRGRIEIEREPVSVPALVADVVESFRPFAEAKQVTVSGACHGLDEPVAIDANVCRQILLNLLDNAVKYGPPGQTVQVSVDRAPGGVRLMVADEGPGIDAAQAARIWEPFWRAPGSSEGGSGLGLAIVSELASRHGGSAALEPAAHGRRGARFVVTLNADAPATAPDRRVPQPA